MVEAQAVELIHGLHNALFRLTATGTGIKKHQTGSKKHLIQYRQQGCAVQMTYVAEPHHRGNALRCPGQLHEACRLHRKPLQNICCVSNHLRYTAAACGLNDIRCLPNLLRLHGLLLHGKGCRAGHSISLQGRLHQFNFHFRGPPDIPALRPGGSFLLLLSQDCEMYSQHTQAVQEK